MTLIEEILQTNENFCANPPADYSGEDVHASKLPQKKLAIVTCMDTRLVNFLEPALGITRGDVKVIKTAGNYCNWSPRMRNGKDDFGKFEEGNVKSRNFCRRYKNGSKRFD